MVNTLATRSETDTRLFEMRIYYAAPGKLDDLNARSICSTSKVIGIPPRVQDVSATMKKFPL